MKRIDIILIFLFSIIVFGVFGQVDSKDKIDSDLLKKFETNLKNDYIILMKDRLVFNHSLPSMTKKERGSFVYNALRIKADKTQRNVVSLLNNSDATFTSLWAINSLKVRSDEATLLKIASLPEVEKIIADTPFYNNQHLDEGPISSARNPEPEWGILKIKADSVWMMGIEGEGVVVGGQDTGVDWEVSPLKSKYRGYTGGDEVSHDYSWFDAIHENQSLSFFDTLPGPCGYNSLVPCDDNSHGTHTVGTMVGGDDENAIGVAPGAKWIACKNMDRGWGRISSYVECFQWFIAPTNLEGKNADPTKAPHVINNSWYCSPEEGCNPSNFNIIGEALDNVRASGIVVVVSAGNDGRNGCGSIGGPPAIYKNAFVVGATDIEDNIAGFSSRGPVIIDQSFRMKPDVVAPGVGTRSVLPGGGFGNKSGTSMSGPHVAGLVALMISANPEIAGYTDEIEDIIRRTATPLQSEEDCEDISGQSIPNPIFGYGLVNALAAVEEAMKFVPSSTVDNRDNSVVFPNPALDFVTFNLEESSQGIQSVSIFDLNGNRVFNGTSGDSSSLRMVDISHLMQGIYIFEISTVANKKIRGKFIKI